MDQWRKKQAWTWQNFYTHKTRSLPAASNYEMKNMHMTILHPHITSRTRQKKTKPFKGRIEHENEF